MADIMHRVGIEAPQQQVYDTLTTIEGISGWWTREVDGDPAVGGTLRFFFGGTEPSVVMEVAEATPCRHVGWRCVQGPDDWVGTRLTFDLTSSGDETVLLFSHADWREPTESLAHCSTKWGFFLLGLKASFEGGQATPYPGELQVSSWG
jgi:uncharacterized protein YndB with AHSA1/START domain